MSGVRKEYDLSSGVRGKYASRARSSSKLVVLVAALAAVGTLAWFVVRGRSTAETERADNPEVELSKDSQAGVSADMAPLEARSAEKGNAEGGAETAAIPRTAPDRSGTSTTLRTDSRARVHAGSRDARSGAAIPGLRLEFVEDVAAPAIARISYAGADRKGIVERDSFLVGRWRITASSARHRPLVLGTFNTSAERLLDLGLITLEPLPVLRGRLLDATGKPAGGNTISEVEMHGRPTSERLVTATDADGSFELVGDLDRHFLLQVNPIGVQSGVWGQRFALDRPPEGEEIVLQLAVYQHLILNVYDISLEYSIRPITLCPDVGEPTEPDTRSFAEHGEHEPLVRPRELQSSTNTRRFECYVAAGRYRVRGGVPSIKLEMQEGLPECEFSMRGH